MKLGTLVKIKKADSVNPVQDKYVGLLARVIADYSRNILVETVVDSSMVQLYLNNDDFDILGFSVDVDKICLDKCDHSDIEKQILFNVSYYWKCKYCGEDLGDVK